MTAFNRDRFTWLAYAMLGYYSFMQASLGPLMPFLGTELDLNYTERGLHLSAFAIGLVLTGLSADRLARRVNRHFIFWAGGAGMAIFAGLLSLGKTSVVTIGCTFFMAYLGSFLLIMIQATLSDRHGEQRTFALTEANIIASVTAAIAPLVIGFGQAISFGWRLVIYIGIAAWGLAFIVWRGVPMPEEHHLTIGDIKAFWAYWLVIFLGVSVEWCMIFWSSDYLEKIAVYPKTWPLPVSVYSSSQPSLVGQQAVT
jgi:MFS family permease